MRRAMRAFKAQEQMKNSKVRNSDRDCAAPRQRPQKLRVNPTTREVYADRPTSQKRTGTGHFLKLQVSLLVYLTNLPY